MTTTLAARERLAQWWRLRTATERRAWMAAGALALAVLAWLLLLRPLQQNTERLQRQIATQRVALLEARRQADDIAGLARNTAALPARDARADLDAALARHGLKPTAIDRIDDQHLRVTFDNIGFDAMAGLLETLQRDARLRVVDLTAAARVEAGSVRAEMTLAGSGT